jgi:Phosphorylase superfamily
VYAQTRGPRFETPVEIRMLATHGHIVGMTCAHEVMLCNEIKLPYAVVCMVDNVANGLAEKELSVEEFHAGVAQNQAAMDKIFQLLISKFAPAVVANSAAHKRVDTIVHARYVVQIEPDKVLREHSIVVDNVCISFFYPSPCPSSPVYCSSPLHPFTLPSTHCGQLNCNF